MENLENIYFFSEKFIHLKMHIRQQNTAVTIFWLEQRMKHSPIVKKLSHWNKRQAGTYDSIKNKILFIGDEKWTAESY